MTLIKTKTAGGKVGKWESGKLLLLALLTFSLSHFPTFAAAPAVTLEPYGTISWTGLEGEADLGAGVNLTLGITKNLSIVTFAEGDSTQDPSFFDQIDRAGAGLRYTAWLGSRVSLDAGVAGAWDIQNSDFFLRLPLGANLYAVKTKNLSLGLRAQYAFDISGDGPNGTATGRAFIGPTASFRF